MRMHGVAFAVGVVASFIVLAVVLLALRGTGAALGWGFQLQSPWVVTALAVLFFLLALNLSGVFEILVPLPDAPVQAPRHPLVGSFGAGVLAAVSASPCTAPFMGAALGFAITQSATLALAVFAALGVGMALPYALLSWFPAWLKRLPRPGPWLVRLKQFLAFPLYATVVWLVWVLGLQAGMEGVLRIGIVLVVLALASWLWGLAQRGAGSWTRIGAAVAVVVAILFALPIETEPPAESRAAASASDWTPYSQARVDELVASGKPVFVDFTAAWCVTCQVNKKLVLETEAVRGAFASKSVTLMRADWTRRDVAITEALAALGRNGVPVYVLYRPGKAPLVLPEILQRSTIDEALGTL
ncbi:MAG: thioredoxin family protein, partial [Burkholderiales bacterium]